MKLALGCDHAGFDLMQEVKKHLEKRGIEYTDYGTYSTESCHYPIFAEKAARAVVSGECERGILICGTGVGISIAANKVHGIRASLCNDLFTARLTREHNDSNMLCMGGRVVGLEVALNIVDVWLDTPYSNSGNHPTRLKLIQEIEQRG